MKQSNNGLTLYVLFLCLVVYLTTLCQIWNLNSDKWQDGFKRNTGKDVEGNSLGLF
jgi:hypothetical protein